MMIQQAISKRKDQDFFFEIEIVEAGRLSMIGIGLHPPVCLFSRKIMHYGKIRSLEHLSRTKIYLGFLLKKKKWPVVSTYEYVLEVV